MNAATISAPKTLTASKEGEVLDCPVRRRPARLRPPGRSVRTLAPRSRPVRPLAAPSGAAAPPSRARACCGESAPVAAARSEVRVQTRTRITDRGIALILVTGAMIVLAALTVVSLTALRVTSDSYQPLSAAYAAQQ